MHIQCSAIVNLVLPVHETKELHQNETFQFQSIVFRALHQQLEPVGNWQKPV